MSIFNAKKYKIILSELSRLVRPRRPGVWRAHHQEDKKKGKYNHTVCPGSSDPFYVVTYYIKWVTTVCPGSSDPFYIASLLWVTTSWTYCTILWNLIMKSYNTRIIIISIKYVLL